MLGSGSSLRSDIDQEGGLVSMFRRTVFLMALALTMLATLATSATAATGIERIELRVEGMT